MAVYLQGEDKDKNKDMDTDQDKKNNKDKDKGVLLLNFRTKIREKEKEMLVVKPQKILFTSFQLFFSPGLFCFSFEEELPRGFPFILVFWVGTGLEEERMDARDNEMDRYILSNGQVDRDVEILST